MVGKVVDNGLNERMAQRTDNKQHGNQKWNGMIFRKWAICKSPSPEPGSTASEERQAVINRSRKRDGARE